MAKLKDLLNIKSILNYLLNELPLLKLLDGKKTAIAGALVATGTLLTAIAEFLPEDKKVAALAAAKVLNELAGYIGIWGVAGKTAKL